MSEIKTLKENFRTSFIQISYKILKVRDVYEKVLKEVTCTRAQNQRRPQSRPKFHKYLQFHNIN